jgi:hypothetical protein
MGAVVAFLFGMLGYSSLALSLPLNGPAIHGTQPPDSHVPSARSRLCALMLVLVVLLALMAGGAFRTRRHIPHAEVERIFRNFTPEDSGFSCLRCRAFLRSTRPSQLQEHLESRACRLGNFNSLHL